MKLYYYLLLILLIGCSKDSKERFPNRKPAIVNKVYVSDFKDSAYQSIQGGRIIISPTITRDYAGVDEKLKFEWRIENRIVSIEQNLNIALPDFIPKGVIEGNYVITDILRGIQYATPFKIEICDISGYGYYFLSVDSNNNSLLSYLPTDYQTREEPFHRTKLGDLPIGKGAHSLNSRAIYDFQADCVKHNLYITSEFGEHPHIIIDNRSANPIGSLSNRQNGKLFAPTLHLLGHRETGSHFINNNAHLYYNNEILEKENGTTNYAFQYLIIGNNDQTIYAFDKNTHLFYQIRNDGSNQISPIKNSLPLNDEILLNHITTWSYQNGILIEKIDIITSSATKIFHYQIINNGESEMSLIHTFQTNEQAYAALFIDNEICYVAVGSSILKYKIDSKKIHLFKKLDPLWGPITFLASDDERLISTTYDFKSTLPLKGSIQFIDFQTKEITFFCNSLHRGVGIVCCAKNNW